MERALDPGLLSEALGEHVRLPSPERLGDLLARAEIDLFFGALTEHAELLVAAWYLHSVAAARPQDVDPLRRSQAGRVSAHIFDVFLQGSTVETSETERLRSVVAAQYGYLVGDLTPNSIALGSQLSPETPTITSNPGAAALHAAVLLLALDRRRLRSALDAWAAEQGQLSQVWGDLDLSPYAPASAVISGIRQLLAFLTTGLTPALDEAGASFRQALDAEGGHEDTDARWVAALMLDLGEDLANSSVFAVLPPELGPTAQALVLSEPSVLMFWPPQERFLRGDPSPLDPATRRQVLAFPTSAGKTLVSQVLIMSHIQQSDHGDVCVVAPTHSLCREIQEALTPRLNLLRTTVADAGPEGSGTALPTAERVVVMTPERLAGLVRNDPDQCLERFNLFVIDEAHLLAERERGWGLEEALTILHHLTRETDHRLVLVSAAMGADAHVVSWIRTEDEPLVRSDNWRGPRRLYALYTTEFGSAADTVVVPAKGTRRTRRHVPVHGRIHLRQSSTEVVEGGMRDPVGTQVFRETKKLTWETAEGTTSQLDRVQPLLHHLVENRKTPTLAIVAIREEARTLAKAVAQNLPVVLELSVLVDRVKERVGENHLLPELISRGVAYHHGALPTDVQAEIEDAARAGLIRCLVATATLTEGVNLPFKAVVIVTTGYGNPKDPEKWVTVIDPPRLVNALGRAGRACRETEAWLFLVHHDAYQPSMFDPMQQQGSDLVLTSSLNTPKALEDLAAFELLVALGADAVFADSGKATNGFCAFVWHVAELLSKQGAGTDLPAIMSVVEESLAWTQADASLRARWQDLATAAAESYANTPTGTRRRYALSGASLAGAAALDTIRAPAADAVAAAHPTSIREWLDALLGDGRLQQVLTLPDNRIRYFRPYRSAGVDRALDIDLLALLQRWVEGAELEALGAEFLTGIANEDYRAEALSEFTSTVFEHHLPWALGSLIEWVNAELVARGIDIAVPPSVASHVHFGVTSGTAVELMLGGVRSRRLAQKVASILGPNVVDLRPTLADLGIQGWRDQFQAHPAELRDLLMFVRRNPEVLTRVLAGQPVEIPITGIGEGASGDAVLHHGVGLAGPLPLEVHVGDAFVGQVVSDLHDEVNQLLDLGFPLTSEYDHETRTLVLALAPA
jgi:superfamily II DNA/RNA helicase